MGLMLSEIDAPDGIKPKDFRDALLKSHYEKFNSETQEYDLALNAISLGETFAPYGYQTEKIIGHLEARGAVKKVNSDFVFTDHGEDIRRRG